MKPDYLAQTGSGKAMRPELLAPAGSFETMKAAICAGADAVYLGGQLFGARAYAGNLTDEELLEAIDYAHLHGVSLYLTVNTLLKDAELEEALDSFLRPLYVHGLDAVIVQDYGVMSYIRKAFPKMAVHASTQMTMGGPESARILEELGASRIATPRELSLAEIREIRQNSNLEIESFIHGALCYCYSGQCLMSSLIGGRSGNRGRCAQPCRLNYLASDASGAQISKKSEEYLLSPKDMNTVAILPEIIEAGVTSLKIEGRMKKPEYTAGVVSIYRKYLDFYLENGKEGYRVTKEDQKILFDLFNRNGFHESYYKQKNGRNMITLEKPAFREENEPLFESIRERCIRKEKQEPVTGFFSAYSGTPITLTLSAGDMVVTAEGPVPDAARNAGATEESVKKQLLKTGGSAFFFEELTVSLEEGLFLPVSALNSLRREAFEALRETIVSAFRREDEGICPEAPTESEEHSLTEQFTALVSTREQLSVVLREERIARVYLESTIAEAGAWKTLAESVRAAGKECYLALPAIFRPLAKRYFERAKEQVKEAAFDGFLIRSLEELAFCREFPDAKLVSDANLYVWNHRAGEWLKEEGIAQLTAPQEFHEREYRRIASGDMEMPVYDRAVMMVSAQCIRNTTMGCTKKPEQITLTDRMKKDFPVLNVCRYCYNLIYNTDVRSLLAELPAIRKMGFGSYRLSFVLEDGSQTAQVLSAFLHGAALDGAYTRGHYRRGVE